MLFNVAAAVVDLIEAPTEEVAKEMLLRKIAASDLDFYEGTINSPTGVDAFESEPVT